MPHRSGRPLAWALLALLALPAFLAAGLCLDCVACPMQTTAARQVGADCHGPASAQLVADCCVDMAIPAPPASDRALESASARASHAAPPVLAGDPLRGLRHASLAAAQPRATPPVHGVRLHTLFSVYLI